MPNASKKYVILGIVGFLIVSSMGWYGFMRYSLKKIEKEIARLENNLKQQDFEITHNPIQFTHTLFALKATIPDLHLKTPEEAVSWESSAIHVTIHPWTPKRIALEIPHLSRATLGKTSFFPLKEGLLNDTEGTLTLTSKGEPQALALKVDRIQALAQDKVQPLSLHQVSLSLDNLSTPLTASIDAFAHIKGLEALLGKAPTSELPTVSLKADLSGFQGTIPGPHSLAEWRDGGGVLEVRSLNFTWNPLEITADGTLTVDKDLYPLGSFSSHIKGYEEGLKQLVKAGFIKEQSATMAGFFLNMLSQSNGKGDKTIKVPLTLQDRHLSLGVIPLMQLK